MQPNKINLQEELLSSAQVQKTLHITRKTLFDWRKLGIIEPIKLTERKLLYRAKDVENLLNERYARKS